MFSTAVRFFALAAFVATARAEELDAAANPNAPCISSSYIANCYSDCARCVYVEGTEGDYTVDIDTTLCKSDGVSNAFPSEGTIQSCVGSNLSSDNKCEDSVDGFRLTGVSGSFEVGTKDGKFCNAPWHVGQFPGFDPNADPKASIGTYGQVVETCFTEFDFESCGGTPPTNPPPGTGGGGADPHFMNWGGEWFDYQGECDMVMLDAPAFAQGLGLDVHIRTKIQYDYSYISNAAFKIGDEIFEVASKGDYFLNGISGVDMPAMISGFPISYNKVDGNQVVFSIELGHEQHARIKVFKDFVTIKFEGALVQDFGDSVGLMGDFMERGVLKSRDGAAMSVSEPNEFAQEWQVRDTDPLLFQTYKYPQYPAKCILPEEKAFNKSNLRLSASVN